ncbi:acetyl-CoA C-acyltransferase, partial [Pseudomonas syringae pv. tagetis]
IAADSHRKAAQAQASGAFREETVPVATSVRGFGADGRPWEQPLVREADEGVRPDTTPEALARLKPAFKAGGTVTAGNASKM